MRTIIQYVFLFAYFTAGLFLLGLIVKVFLGFVKLGEFYLPNEEIMRNLFKSIIAGAAITLAAIVFNLIDKCNSRKSPPSDSD